MDGVFNEDDLIIVFQAGEYEDEQVLNSTYATGDWNGDGEFTSRDIVFVFVQGGFPATAPVPAIYISEFSAANDTFFDADGDTSDWIEIFNPTSSTVNLNGWSLTDDATELGKWSFPEIQVEPKEHLLVYASGKNRRDASDELHTNFRLRASGEYLGLVAPDEIIAHEFAPTYPAQDADNPFGIASSSTLLLSDEPFRYYAPTPADRGLTTEWTTRDFNDAEWQQSDPGAIDTGIGFRLRNASPQLAGLFQTDTGQVRNTTLLVRQPFSFVGRSFDAFVLRTNFDDGFVAYLNGEIVAQANAPDQLDWNSKSTLTHSSHESVRLTEFDISDHRSLLQNENVLAVHMLNRDIRDTDFVMRAELIGYKMAESRSRSPVFLSKATPGFVNRHDRGPRVKFSLETQFFSEPLALELSAADEAVIHYTTDGSQPNATSPVYESPIAVSANTIVKAMGIMPGQPIGEVTRELFVTNDPNLESFFSDLPVMVFENFAGGDTRGDDFQLNLLTVYEPDPQTRRTDLTREPTLVHQVGLRKRGSSTVTRPKAPYAMEFWNESNEDVRQPLLGMPADSDWVLTGPLEFDRAFIRNTLANELSRQMGRYAARTRFVELFYNQDGQGISDDEYRGLYVLSERIKRGEDRVDLQRLTPRDNSEPKVSGGWILKRDRPGPGEDGFEAGGLRIQFVDPKEDDVTPEQHDWITDRINRMARSLRNPDPATGYPSIIDIDSWIDHHLLRVLTMEVDALSVSTFFYMDRDGKIHFGPIWDNDRSMGSDRDGRSDNPETWHFVENKLFAEPWWRDLFQDESFTQRWVDRWFELRKSTFSSENIENLIELQSNQVREAQERNFLRWREFAPIKKTRPEFEFSDPGVGRVGGRGKPFEELVAKAG